MYDAFSMWRALVLHRLSQNRMELELVWNEQTGTSTSAEQIGTFSTQGILCQHESNQEPVVLGNQEPGTGGTLYPRNKKPVVVGNQEPGTGGTLYPRNKEPVVLGNQEPGTGVGPLIFRFKIV